MKASELKALYPISRAWLDLGLAGTPGKCVCSPLREDRSPSFSVCKNGTRFKDFGTGESGDVFDLVARVRGCDSAAAIAWVKEHLNITPTQKPTEFTKARSNLPPPLREGTSEELRELSNHRGFAVEALKLAQQRGFLYFTRLWGLPAWCITDVRRQLHEFRRLDSGAWLAYGRLQKRKAHCIGAGKDWPIGTKESAPFSKIVMTEGSPDLLAAFHFILIEGKEQTIAPVAILGASNHRLAPDALAHFENKSVCIYPHADEAGQKALPIWAKQLKAAGAARVMAFNLSGLKLVDGSTGKDLAEIGRAHV